MNYKKQQKDSFCCANQLTGFYMRATLALNGLNADHSDHSQWRYRKRCVRNYLSCVGTFIFPLSETDTGWCESSFLTIFVWWRLA